MQKTLTSKFLDSIWQFANEPISENIKKQAELCVYDYLACVYLGYQLNKEKTDNLIESSPDSGGNTRIFGTEKRGSIYTAVLANGFNAHFAELDDGHRFAMMHVGCIVVSDLFAIADNYDISYDQFIKGIVVGYEAAVRLGSAMQPGHKLKGYHTTGTCGTIGAAIGIAAALSYTKEQMSAVLAAAVTSAGGLLEIQEDKSELKPYNASQACVSAISAAMIGRVGYNPPNDILGGGRGLFSVLSGTVEEQYLLGLEKTAIETIYRKYYAACRHCHSAIEATMNCLKEGNADSVSNIRIDTYGMAIKGHDYKENLNIAAAKLSMPFSLALAVKYGDVNEDRYSEDNLNDESLKNIMSIVELKEDPEITALVPKKRAAVSTVTFMDGSVISNRVDYPLGEPENPISIEIIEEKVQNSLDKLYQDENVTKRKMDQLSHLESSFKEII